MSKYIKLEDAKQHLRVDFYDDDAYIEGLISMVEMAVEIEIGDPAELKEDEEGDPISGLEALEDSEGNIPERLKQSMLLMLGHFYLVREPVVIGVSAVKIPYGFDWLIAPFKNWTIQ